MNPQLPAETSVQDLEAVILAQVYQMILTWPAPLEEQLAGFMNIDQESEPADELPAQNGPDE